MSSLRLDDVDISLIRALQKDSRISLKELARAADISVPTARARVERLSRLGVIKQFTVAIDPQKLVGAVTAYLSLKVKLPDLKSVGEALAHMDEVTEVHITTGEYDLVAKVCVLDMRALEEFIMHKLSKVPGVEHAHSSVVVETPKELYGPLVRPGFGIVLFCPTCRKEIRDEPVRRSLHGVEFYFCCNTCASTYEELAKKRSQL